MASVGATVGTSDSWLSSVMMDSPLTSPTICGDDRQPHRDHGAKGHEQHDHRHAEADHLAQMGLGLGDL